MTPKVATQYKHVQDVAASTWNVNHNLGMYPIVDVYILTGGTLQKVIPAAVTYVDANNCTISFDDAQAGFAAVV